MNNAKPNPLAPAQIPEKASVDGLETKWVPSWEQAAVYGFNPDAPKENIYSIDTPPPTASGSLHVGHVFSYTHTGISPGQACVFYSKDDFGDKLLGGGWISKTENKNLST